MQLVTFAIDKDKNLIVQFPIYIQPYTQQPLILYQLETVLVPVIDQNTRAHSNTHLQVEKPYIALNSEKYISLWQQELRTCKRIGYELSCEELFCEAQVQQDITTTVLDGGNEIILANWPNDKHIICNINNDIPVRIPSHPYVLVNRSVLCNCSIEADNHYLLESLAPCDETKSKLIMYFTVNTAFVNYLDMFPNLTELLEFPVIKNRTTYKHTLPISLNMSKFDKTLLTAPTNLKDFMNSYTKHKGFL